MTSRVTLVGYRACGKTTIGRLVAARLGWPFLDADHALEERLDSPIAAFYAVHGDTVFRDREEALLAELLGAPGPLVLATGGGAIIRAATRERLRSQGGLVVWLQAEAAVVQARLRRNLGGRMSLSGASPVDEAPRIMAQREPWYREVATLVLAAHGREDELADAIVQALG